MFENIEDNPMDQRETLLLMYGLGATWNLRVRHVFELFQGEEALIGFIHCGGPSPL